MANRAESALKTADKMRFARNVLVKALALFMIANLAFAWWYPMAGLGRLSAYNHLFPGRLRLPYGDNPQRAYNLSLFNLEAMFAAHEISTGPKPANEYRVIVIGDSATWGFLLPPGQTLTAYLNAVGPRLTDGRQVRSYNLAYPVMSLAKDLLLLSYALHYQPDLVVWPVTLESFPSDKQLYSPLLQNNAEAMRRLIETYDLELDPHAKEFVELTGWDRTIIGARRPLADLLRLQFYGVLWAATGIDQDLPASFTSRQEDLEADESFHGLLPPHLNEVDLSLEVISAALQMAAPTPVLLINEPMFISQGKNSDIRYNFYYPRWAYDEYRTLLYDMAQTNGWRYLDLWEAIPSGEFTNTAVHMTPLGTQQFARIISQAILELANLP